MKKKILGLFILILAILSCTEEKEYVLEVKESALQDSLIGVWSFEHVWECYTSDTVYRSDYIFIDTCYFTESYFGADLDSLSNEWFVDSDNGQLLLYFTDIEIFGFQRLGFYYATDIENISYDFIRLTENYFQTFLWGSEDLYTECDRQIVMRRIK